MVSYVEDELCRVIGAMDSKSLPLTSSHITMRVLDMVQDRMSPISGKTPISTELSLRPLQEKGDMYLFKSLFSHENIPGTPQVFSQGRKLLKLAMFKM